MQRMTPTDGQSLNVVDENIAALRKAFPEAFTEDGIDFEVLRQLLGDRVADGEEKYGLNWFGKKKARQIALTPSMGTLRPCPKESVDWDTTQNLFIEGDNLEVLKLLQRSYSGKVKFIYIDPPYNTGKDFIYPDNYQDNLDTYLRYTKQKDEKGLSVSSNPESSGRYHTKWLSMMYPRLKLARALLANDGVIFVSINHKEVANLRYLMDDVFGEGNLLCMFSWRSDGNFDNQAKFKYCHEYILTYAKNEEDFPHPPTIDKNTPVDSKIFKVNIRNTVVKNGPKNPPSSIKLPVGFPAAFSDGEIQEHESSWPHYKGKAEIINGKLSNEVEIYSGWSSKDLLLEFIRNGCEPIYDAKGQETTFEIIKSGAIELVKVRGESSHVLSALTGLGGPQKASTEVEETGVIFDDYPKPIVLIKYLLSMVSDSSCIALDFFAGSGTTAHAVMDLNAEDGGNRKFIMVQLPEPTEKVDEKGKIKTSQAFKSGFKTISEVAQNRIKGARKNFLEKGSSGDFGFKFFKLDSSNIVAWSPDEADLERTLIGHAEPLFPGRSEKDILYELLLKRGVELTTSIEEKNIAGKKVYSIGLGVLFACLDKNIQRDQIEELAHGIIDWHNKLDPISDTQVVFRDSAFESDVTKANMTVILEQNGIKHVRSL